MYMCVCFHMGLHVCGCVCKYMQVGGSQSQLCVLFLKPFSSFTQIRGPALLCLPEGEGSSVNSCCPPAPPPSHMPQDSSVSVWVKQAEIVCFIAHVQPLK